MKNKGFFYSFFIITFAFCNFSFPLLKMNFFDELQSNPIQAQFFDEKSNDKPFQENQNNFKSKDKNDCIKGIILTPPNEVLDIDDINEYKIIQTFGLKLPLKEEELSLFIYCLIGKKITKNNIENLKIAIEQFYQSSPTPFVLIIAPEQIIKKGYILFHVYESKTDNFNILGNKFFKKRYFEKLSSLKKKDPINLNKIANDLYWINKNPFINAFVLFKPGSKDFTTDVDYLIEDLRPLRFYSGIDNTGFEATGYNRFYTGVNWGNVWEKAHIFTFQYTFSNKFSRFQSFTSSYELPLFHHHSLQAFGGYAFFKPSSKISDLANKGRNYQASLRYTFALPPVNRRQVQDFALGFDFKKTNINFIFRDRPLITPSSTIITQFAFKYNFHYEYKCVTIPIDANLYLSPFKFCEMQSNTNYSFLRYKAKSQYAYGNFSISPFIYFSNKTFLSMNFQSQLSSTNLISSEQFGLGGYNTVRGYEYREMNKDNGFLSSFEYGYSTNIKKLHYTHRWKIFGFIDFGCGWDVTKTPGVKNFEYLLGIGPGIRYSMSPYINIRLDWGFKLHKTIFDPNNSIQRVDFGLFINL